MMKVHGYTDAGSIGATIDGVFMIVPDHPANRHRQMIAVWEALGNTIPPYEASPPSAPEISAERDRRVLSGVTVTVTGYGPVPIQGRPTDQVNMLALKDTARDLSAAGVATAVIPFRDRDNVDHMLTPSQMMELVDAGKRHMQAVYSASWALKAMDPIPADYADDKHWP